MIEIREIKDLKTAEALWREISPRRVIYDDFDYRYGFYKYDPYPLCFLAAYDVSQSSKDLSKSNEEFIALMPLVQYPEFGKGFFAEEPCEENRVFIKEGREDAIKPLYESLKATEKIQFYDVSAEDEYSKTLKLEDYKYVLPLENFKNFNDFLEARLSHKRRHSLEKELAAIENLKPEIVINDFSDLENLFKFNIGSFAEESYLTKESERDPWRELLNNKNFAWRMTSLKINGQTAAVSLACLYNGYYHYLLTGVDFRTYPGLGKYLNKINIEAAISLGANYFDAGLGDCGWKHLWHFDRIPQYEYVNF